MNTRRSYWRAAVAVSSTAIVLAGLCLATSRKRATHPQSTDPVTVIRYLNSHGYVAAYEIAAALGWLEDKGIRIRSQGYSQGGPESLVAMASGSVDLAGAATLAIINAMAGGAKILGVMPNGGINKDVSSKFFVLADSEINTPRELKDKSIAVNTLGAHLDYTVREYLRNHGLREGDAQLITAPGPQLDQILRHKQADVIAVGAWQSAFAGSIEAEGGVRVLFTITTCSAISSWGPTPWKRTSSTGILRRLRTLSRPPPELSTGPRRIRRKRERWRRGYSRSVGTMPHWPILGGLRSSRTCAVRRPRRAILDRRAGAGRQTETRLVHPRRHRDQSIQWSRHPRRALIRGRYDLRTRQI
jgi:hypothetical protein